MHYLVNLRDDRGQAATVVKAVVEFEGSVEELSVHSHILEVFGVVESELKPGKEGFVVVTEQEAAALLNAGKPQPIELEESVEEVVEKKPGKKK